MRRWSELAERVAATTRTSVKTSLLAEYLRDLPPDELRVAAVFLAGRPFPGADQRATGLGWATIASVVSRVAGAPAEALGEAYDRSSDLGTSVADVLGSARDRRAPGGSSAPAGSSAPGRSGSADPANGELPGGPSLADVADAFAGIESASGPTAKGIVFGGLLERCDPLTAKYVVKILTGELRIGLREGLLEAAVGQAFGRPLPEVQWAGMLTGDVGETAVLAREDRLDEARLTLLHPLTFMLAAPAEDAAEILARLGPTVWVEDKYDGIRAQLHRRGREVRLYSRDLHDISGQFPEIVAGALELPWDGILDGEILAFRDSHVLPFLALQTRLGRTAPSAAIQAEVPVIYVAFDLLAVGPSGDPAVEPMLRIQLAERRRRLATLGLPLAEEGGVFALSHLMTVDSIEALDRVFEEARARRNEGLMVKDPESVYSPGRRGYGWLKMKKALATIDCIVVGVEAGHGKRHGVLSDYTFAVRDEASGNLVTIGKAYSGLTDAEIASMTAWFEAHTLRRLGRFRVVEPTIVVEVAFDVIQRSPRHQSGFSLRFPRIARLRPDKTAAEIDTLETVERLYRELQLGAEHLVTARARQIAQVRSVPPQGQPVPTPVDP